MALLNISKYSCCTNIVQIVLPVKRRRERQDSRWILFSERLVHLLSFFDICWNMTEQRRASPCLRQSSVHSRLASEGQEQDETCASDVKALCFWVTLSDNLRFQRRLCYRKSIKWQISKADFQKKRRVCEGSCETKSRKCQETKTKGRRKKNLYATKDVGLGLNFFEVALFLLGQTLVFSGSQVFLKPRPQNNSLRTEVRCHHDPRGPQTSGSLRVRCVRQQEEAGLHVGITVIGQGQGLQPVVHLSPLGFLWLFTRQTETERNRQ